MNETMKNQIIEESKKLIKGYETISDHTFDESEKEYKFAKAKRAEANSILREISDLRISFKQECLIPYEILERELNENIVVLKNDENLLKDFINSFDLKLKEIKSEEINEIFNDLGVYNEEFKTKIFNRTWLNKTTPLSVIKKDIIKKVEVLEKEIEILKNMKNSEVLIEKYMNDDKLSFADILNLSETSEPKDPASERKFMITTVSDEQFTMVENLCKTFNIKMEEC